MQNILNVYTISCNCCPFLGKNVFSSAENRLKRGILEWYAENFPRQSSESWILSVNNSITRRSKSRELSKDFCRTNVQISVASLNFRQKLFFGSYDLAIIALDKFH